MNDRHSVIEQAKNAVVLSGILSGKLLAMSELHPQRVGERLRALYSEMRMATVDEFAELLGVERNRASNWLNGINLPKPNEMVRLCELTGVTLDWIYRGVANTLPLDKAIRLQALVDEMQERTPGQPGLAPAKAPKASRRKARATD